jgi:hypothetical protein
MIFIFIFVWLRGTLPRDALRPSSCSSGWKVVIRSRGLDRRRRHDPRVTSRAASTGYLLADRGLWLRHLLCCSSSGTSEDDDPARARRRRRRVRRRLPHPADAGRGRGSAGLPGH